MKISFLIPSKNRVSLLKQAVASIIDQREMEFEIIISDNASSEDYSAYVGELNDERIVYYRQLDPVSVTENWKRALSLATGDYILMLGDDDALAPRFFSGLREYLTQNGPEVVYLAAYHYCYPDVLADNPAGYLASVLNSEFLASGQKPFTLDQKYAHELAESVLAFRCRFGLNAQHFLLKASFIRRFSAIGGIYQSPYPDTFSALAAFTHASSILVVPSELVIIGISPKSFGAYYFSGRHDEGYRFLDNEQVDPTVRASLQHVILPGDRNDTNWLVASESARQAFPTKLSRQVDFVRYRTLQMIGVLRDCHLYGRQDIVAELRARLSESEFSLFDVLESALRVIAEKQPKFLSQFLQSIVAQLGQYVPAIVTYLDIGTHKNIWDAYTWLRKNENLGYEPAGRPLTAAFEEQLSGNLPSAPNIHLQNQQGRSTSKFDDFVRARVRLVLMIVPAVRRHYERIASNAHKAKQLQFENEILRRQLREAGALRRE
jgi:glycosyltransferase involved in cell wall biosynthesis